MGFKPMTKYFPASNISKKGYEILKERAYRISKEKAYNILAFMECKPMTSITISFPVYEIRISKPRAHNILAFIIIKTPK